MIKLFSRGAAEIAENRNRAFLRAPASPREPSFFGSK